MSYLWRLASYHNSSWTCASNHIRSHNIATPQDIVGATALATELEPLPIHKLLASPPVKKEPLGDVDLMQHAFAAPSCRTDTQAYHRINCTIAKWIAADCLPYRTIETCAFMKMMRSLDPKCPNFYRNTLTSQVRH